MPIDTEQTFAIACDNPACPGNELDPADRSGWLFVTHERDGVASSSVYCSVACVGTHTTMLAATSDAW